MCCWSSGIKGSVIMESSNTQTSAGSPKGDPALTAQDNRILKPPQDLRFGTLRSPHKITVFMIRRQRCTACLTIYVEREA